MQLFSLKQCHISSEMKYTCIRGHGKKRVFRGHPVLMSEAAVADRGEAGALEGQRQGAPWCLSMQRPLSMRGSGPSGDPRLGCWRSACREWCQAPPALTVLGAEHFPVGRLGRRPLGGCPGQQHLSPWACLRAGGAAVPFYPTVLGARVETTLPDGAAPPAVPESNRPLSRGLACLCQLPCHLSQAWQLEGALGVNSAAVYPSTTTLRRTQGDRAHSSIPPAYAHWAPPLGQPQSSLLRCGPLRQVLALSCVEWRAHRDDCIINVEGELVEEKDLAENVT